MDDLRDLHNSIHAWRHILNKSSPIRTGEGCTGVSIRDKVRFPADLRKHVLHLAGNLVIALLRVAGGVEIHLVDTDADLFYAREVTPEVLRGEEVYAAAPSPGPTG